MDDPHGKNGIEQPAPTLAAPVAKLEESIRELIRQEMGHPPPLKPTPNRVEALWLFLCIANAALLLLLLPDALLKNEKWQTLGNLITWLSGSLFVLGSVWFREFFLALSRRRLFKVIQVVLLLLLLPAFVSQRPVFVIHPIIEPADSAELVVDGKLVSEEQARNLRLSLNEHVFIIKPKPGVYETTDPSQDPHKEQKERTFELGRLELLRIWWQGEQPYWPLLLRIVFSAATPVSEVIIQKSGYQFDPKFVAKPPPLEVEEPQQLASIRSETHDGKLSLRYRWPFQYKAGLVVQWLPAGKYIILTKMDNCDKNHSQEIEVTTKLQRIELQDPCANSK